MAKTKPQLALPQPWSPVIHSRAKALSARISASAATPAATDSTMAKSVEEMNCSRCRSTGTTVNGTARLPKRRAQIAHLEVRMRMRMRDVAARTVSCLA